MSNLIREDFEEEGKHQWVAYKAGYRVIIRHYDGGSEVVIRAQLSQDPSEWDWERGLKAVNEFYKSLRIVEERDYRYREDGNE